MLVELFNIHGPAYLMLSAKAKQGLTHGIQEVAKSDVYSPAERECLTEIGKKLCQFWY
ncbi:hypothetical protein OROGR_023896 [Orobanche gracilis]